MFICLKLTTGAFQPIEFIIFIHCHIQTFYTSHTFTTYQYKKSGYM